MASIYGTHKPTGGEGGGIYLKISDGETVKLRIASEPAIYETVPKEGDENARISTRYGWVVYNQDSKQAQILQQSATFFKNVAALAQDEEWGDPTGYDIKITRQGSSFNDTTYNLMPSANREPLDSEAEEAVKKINLIELLEKSPFSQRVMWLADFDKMSREGKAASQERASELGKAANKTTHSEAMDPEVADKVITDIGDEEIDLSDIPF